MIRELQMIPLAELKVSKLNVRKHGAKEIASLAASIAAIGLVPENYAVVPAQRERAGVGAGVHGRRGRAQHAPGHVYALGLAAGGQAQ